MSADQLTLWETPKPQVVDQMEPMTCACCGKTQHRAVFQMNHTTEPDRWCISKVLRRNHVISYARAIATAGEWPGRKGSGPARGWTVEQGYDNLREAIDLATDLGVTKQDIAGIIAAEGIEPPR